MGSWVTFLNFIIIIAVLFKSQSRKALTLKLLHDLEEVTQQTQVLAELLAEMLSWHLGQLFK